MRANAFSWARVRCAWERIHHQSGIGSGTWTAPPLFGASRYGLIFRRTVKNSTSVLARFQRTFSFGVVVVAGGLVLRIWAFEMPRVGETARIFSRITYTRLVFRAGERCR
eukprot:4326032-Pyramimonas_sp.AAC.1